MDSSWPTRRRDFAAAGKLGALELGMHRLALGLAALGGAWGPVDEGESTATVLHALAKGVRAFDAAPAYGAAERLLGAALKQWRGAWPVVSTKVGRLPARDALEGLYDFTPAALSRSLEASLRALGLPRVDLLFLHEPHLVAPAERPRVVAALRELQAAGLARRLGLAGGHGAGWDGFVESGAFDVAMLFRRLDPCVFDGMQEDVPRLRRHRLATYGASPLHMGLLGARFDEFTRARPDWVGALQVARAQRLRELAATHGLPLSTLAHRFAFSVAEIDRVVIGAGNCAQLDAALEDFGAGPLPPQLFNAVCRINSP